MRSTFSEYFLKVPIAIELRSMNDLAVRMRCTSIVYSILVNQCDIKTNNCAWNFPVGPSPTLCNQIVVIRRELFPYFIV